MNRYTKSLLILTLLVRQLIYAQPSDNNVFNGVDFVVNKLKTHDIIAIGETHDKVQVTDFYIDLLNNKSFQELIDVIVIEMGNHLFQDVLDDYIKGEKVDKQKLYKLWRDHTSCMLNNSDNTGLIRLLKKVRDINQNLEKKI
ncbi:MAG: ChaN family lipoprotein, partial [Pseudomonadales bacterium]|nr:ChaN family lipoprotein [Pseudomonadales bacterium]